MKYPLFVALSLFLLTSSYAQTDSAKKITSITVAKIYSDVPLKRGFYKNYKEYITNSPSPPYNFTVDSILYQAGTDSVFEYKAILQEPDSATRGTIHGYGFCDGNAVYLSHTSYNFKMHYWKTYCVGPYPFYTIISKNGTVVPGLPGLIGLASIIVTSAELANDPLVTQVILTFKTRGNPHEVPATPKLVRRVMRQESDLITAFMQEVNAIKAKEDSLQQIIAKTEYSVNASSLYKVENEKNQQKIDDEEKLLTEVMKKYLLLYNERVITKDVKG